jgi:hypothetical protein
VSDDKEEKTGVEERSESIFSEKAPIATRFRQHEERQDEAADFLESGGGMADRRNTVNRKSRDRIPGFLFLFFKLQLYKKCS